MIKRKANKILSLLSIMLLSFTCGCDDALWTESSNSISENITDTLSSQELIAKKTRLQEKAIKLFYETRYSDYEEVKLEDIIIYKDIGIYNNCYVGVLVWPKAVFPDSVESVRVEDLIFDYPCGYDPLVYEEKSNKLYALDEAYKNNILSYSDIKQIYDKFYSK